MSSPLSPTPGELALGPSRPDAEALGIAEFPTSAGLSETEDRAVVEAMHIPALHTYVQAVNAATATWISNISIMALDSVPNAGWRLEHKAGVPADGEYSWLHAMWADKPVSWFVQWECIGHGHTHVGEMVGVRNRLGFGGF